MSIHFYTYNELLASGVSLDAIARLCKCKNVYNWKNTGIPAKFQRLINKFFYTQNQKNASLFDIVEQPQTQHKKYNKNNQLHNESLVNSAQHLGTLRNSTQALKNNHLDRVAVDALKTFKTQNMSIEDLKAEQVYLNALWELERLEAWLKDRSQTEQSIIEQSTPIHYEYIDTSTTDKIIDFSVRPLKQYRTKNGLRFDTNPNFNADCPEDLQKNIDKINDLQDKTELQQNRTLRYNRQNTARSLFKYSDKKRVCSCGRNIAHGHDDVTIMREMLTGRASYAGLQTCGSVWDCAVCSAKISERRRAELFHATQQSMDKHGRDSLIFVTLTFSHSRYDDLGDLLQRLAKATKFFYGHAKYRELKQKIGKFGYARALEVTHGHANGWHPHIHEIWFCDKNQGDYYTIKKEVFALWLDACKSAGLGLPNEEHGVNIKDASYAASYVTKFGDDGRSWGMEDELTKSAAKKARKESRTPWQLLDDCKDGDSYAGQLFKDYSAAFKGKQQVRWSAGLKKIFNVQELSDKEITDKQDAKTYEYVKISLVDWKKICRASTKNFDTRSLILDLSESLIYQDFLDRLDVLCGRVPRSSPLIDTRLTELI